MAAFVSRASRVSKAHEACLPRRARGVLVRDAVFGEVELLSVVTGFFEGCLVEVVIVVHEAAVGHVP